MRVASAKLISMDYIPNRNGVLLEPHVVVARLKANNAGWEEAKWERLSSKYKGSF
jgi:hypothetical protein